MTNNQDDAAVERLAASLNELFTTINMLLAQRALGQGTPRTLRNPRSLLGAITPYADGIEDIRQNPHQDIDDTELRNLAGKARLIYPTRLTEDGNDVADDPIGADRCYDELLARLDAAENKWLQIVAHATFAACLAAEVRQGYA